MRRGGPIFVNPGTVLAADNEAQLAGVLAHEISHVALRHATSQASKANLTEFPAALAAALIGSGSAADEIGQVGLIVEVFPRGREPSLRVGAVEEKRAAVDFGNYLQRLGHTATPRAVARDGAKLRRGGIEKAAPWRQLQFSEVWADAHCATTTRAAPGARVGIALSTGPVAWALLRAVVGRNPVERYAVGVERTAVETPPP